jgi:hypothetical protein
VLVKHTRLITPVASKTHQVSVLVKHGFCASKTHQVSVLVKHTRLITPVSVLVRHTRFLC